MFDKLCYILRYCSFFRFFGNNKRNLFVDFFVKRIFFLFVRVMGLFCFFLLINIMNILVVVLEFFYGFVWIMSL